MTSTTLRPPATSMSPPATARLPWDVAPSGSAGPSDGPHKPAQPARPEPDRPERTSARAAYQLALHDRGILVDIRPEERRQADGLLDPGLPAVVLSPSDLRRRLAPSSPERLGWVPPGARVIVICDDGGAAAVAAAYLARLGLARATHVTGGFQAWRRDGLPVAA